MSIFVAHFHLQAQRLQSHVEELYSGCVRQVWSLLEHSGSVGKKTHSHCECSNYRDFPSLFKSPLKLLIRGVLNSVVLGEVPLYCGTCYFFKFVVMYTGTFFLSPTCLLRTCSSPLPTLLSCSALDPVTRLGSAPNPSHVVERLRRVLTDFQTQLENSKSEVQSLSSSSSSSSSFPSRLHHAIGLTDPPPSLPLSWQLQSRRSNISLPSAPHTKKWSPHGHQQWP